ncbi:MAG: DNA gyrase subunit A [Anaerolineae bacterium]|nr:DNA gyrase subunit A [Anaerolineae bacterium]
MNIGIIEQVDLDSEMRASYLDYAMSVIASRALPDVRDGLKPVHRRILYAMNDMGLGPRVQHKKSARIVGEVLGKYHPHGDQAVYDAMVRMAQDFSLRYMLVDGQGNFGSIDGDSAAAMRYTEARMTSLSQELLTDIDMDTVDFVDNFDGTLQEPSVLPARVPNLLLNGSSGIAVGMATNIPPHNLNELTDAIIYLIDHYDHRNEITVDDLMEFIVGPDFPTGGIIVGGEEIKNAYATGKGRVVVRAVTEIVETKNSRQQIIVTEIPYQISKTTIIERIAEQVRSGRIDMISDLRDESDRNGLRLVVELKRGAQPRKVLNQLLKYTPLQSTFGVQMLALVDGEPRLLSLKRALVLFVRHRQEVIVRRSEFELRKRRERAHILEGLLKALAHLDDIIQTIRNSPDAAAAKDNLMTRFDLSDAQAQAILDMQLRRLAALERQQIEDEYRQVQERIAYLEDLIASPKKVLALIREDMEDLAKRYGDVRRTQIAYDASADFNATDFVRDEEVLISITQRGYIKRIPANTYRAQHRGGKGITGMATSEEDVVTQMFAAGSLESILFFSDKGKVYQEFAYNIPEASRTSKGVLLQSILAMDMDEKITATLTVPSFDSGYLAMITRQGKIKRVPLQAFESVRPSGLIAISLYDNDALCWAKLVHDDQDIIMVTALGQSIRFDIGQVRPMGRTAAGVNALRLYDGDQVAGVAAITDPDADLLIVTANGYGKRSPLNEFNRQNRAGSGVRAIGRHDLKITGPIVEARVVTEADDVTLITESGIVMRTPVTNVLKYGRTARGGQIMKMRVEGDTIASIAIVENHKAAQARNGHGNGKSSSEDINDSEEIVAPPADALDDNGKDEG